MLRRVVIDGKMRVEILSQRVQTPLFLIVGMRNRSYLHSSFPKVYNYCWLSSSFVTVQTAGYSLPQRCQCTKKTLKEKLTKAFFKWFSNCFCYFPVASPPPRSGHAQTHDLRLECYLLRIALLRNNRFFLKIT